MKTASKSFLATADTVQRDWYVVDAADKVLGRLAARLATVLMGKHKPTYTPHVDTGDYVVVLNAGKFKATGARKLDQRVYQHYTGYPGGRKVETLRRVLETRPEFALHEAVRRMMPKNALARHMMSKLKLYRGTDHPHACHSPQPLPM